MSGMTEDTLVQQTTAEYPEQQLSWSFLSLSMG
jgi:hypothetical protein